MASGSPRTRIDQFFASKKKKSLSPSLKSGRGDRDPKASLEAYPSAKGSLDSYLVTSQDDNCTDREGPVKRNLTLETSSLTKYENENISLSAPGHPQNSEAYGEAEKRQSQVPLHMGDICDRGLVNAHSAAGAGNSELKQFAANFLSLYCSELSPSSCTPLEPNQSAHKRQGSPSLLAGEDKSSNKRHCLSDGNESNTESEANCSVEKHAELAHAGLIPRCGEAFMKGSGKMNVENHLMEIYSSLRQCKPTSAIECDTPALTIRARETPKSTRGSSIFSPGEAFWNEAIQVADGFLVKNDILSVQVAGELSITKIQSDIKDSRNFRIVVGNNMANKIFDEGTSRIGGIEISASMRSTGKHGKGSDEEASPLPVKHFDFSSDDKNMDGETLNYSSADNNIGLMLKEGEQHVQEVLPFCDATKYEVGTLRGDHDSIAASTPDKGKRNIVTNIQNKEDSTPSSSLLLKDRLDLSHWLPSEICSTYKKKGISQLYLWQVDCLLVEGVLQRRNLVYCASTSAGKSFVAEILMLRRVLSTGKIALLVLPYVSICAEKAEHLEALLDPLGRHVRSYYGNQGGGTLPKETAVAVCTIEKANSLLNRLLEEGRLSEVGIIVIDELHMVGDLSRGYLLELMLTKLCYAAGEGAGESSSGESSGTSSGKNDPAHGIQIIGMSATLPNVSSVADWLQAALYQTDFRPVPLKEYIKVGNTIYDKRMDIVRTISKTADLSGKDPDHIVDLCNEVVQEGNSVLIFCSSRKGCESTARHVAKFLWKFPASVPNDKHELIDITSAIDALRRSPAGLDPILEETLPFGVAYHHAGLTVEERETVETCYRKGLVRVLTATSTLAAGVNLPARRVIFRQPRIGRDFIDGTRYRQMAGRAGRTGIDTKGESVLICKPEEVKRIIKIVNDSCPPLHSCLSDDKNGMTHALLEVVAGGIVQTSTDVHRYVRCTLLNCTKPFEDVVKSAQESLKWLCHRKFLEWNEDAKLYNTTPLGRASFGSSLCPEESLIVLDDLSRAREGFVLASDLHLVYLVTPTNVEVEPDWELYYERFMELSALDQSVGNRVGVVEPFLMRMAHGAPMHTSNRSRDPKWLMGRFGGGVGMANHNMLSAEQTLRMCKRFYVALILSRLVQEVPVAEVCESFKVARGMVQALQENAGRFASMVSVFCERLGWHDLAGLVSKFQNRVSFGVRAEIVELTTIPFVKGSRARALYKSGLRTPQSIAEASTSELVKALFESSSWSAQEENSAQRRIQLGVAKKIKNGACKIVLDKAEEARVAAFTAFKSLGLDVPEFSRPLPLKAAGDAAGKEATSSSGDISNSSLIGVPSKPVMGRCENLGKLKLQIGQEKSRKNVDVGLAMSYEPKSSGIMRTNFDAENSVAVEDPVILDEISTAVRHMGNAETSSSAVLRITCNDDRTFDEYPDRVEQKQHDRENTYVDNKVNASAKGPINAVNTSGGLDYFLDLWYSARQFYFDIHFTKRSKVNSIVPFEVHGIAICWENSPVYYVNLPKDLFWFNKRNDTLSMDISGSDNYVLGTKHRFDLAKKRWNRICMIMGRKDVRKFTWNLKVQIQVFKIPAVSIQRLGSLNLAVNTLDLELVDSSYYLLSPVYVRDAVDMCIVAWILWPDEERSSNPNLEKEVKKRLSIEAAAAASRSGWWKNQMRIAAHNGCCRRVAQTRALCSVLWRLLISEELVEALVSIEIPLIHSKKRNRLQQKKLNDLVFIKYNRALKRRYDMRDTIDPISLSNIDESNEWLRGRMDEENDEDNEPVFEDDILTWGEVARASGAGEYSQSTRAMTSRERSRTSTANRVQFIDEDNVLSEETENEEDEDGYKSIGEEEAEDVDLVSVDFDDDD